MAIVEFYYSIGCPYCVMAKQLLDSKGVEYTTINVSTDPSLWDEMVQRSRRNTVPQIFINGQSVGGYDDIAILDRKGELDPLLDTDS